jgi:hypothetical protein
MSEFKSSLMEYSRKGRHHSTGVLQFYNVYHSIHRPSWSVLEYQVPGSLELVVRQYLYLYCVGAHVFMMLGYGVWLTAVRCSHSVHAGTLSGTCTGVLSNLSLCVLVETQKCKSYDGHNTLPSVPSMGTNHSWHIRNPRDPSCINDVHCAYV